MRSLVRNKLILVLCGSVVALAFAVPMFILRPSAGRVVAAPATSTVSYTGTAGALGRLNTGTAVPRGVVPNLSVLQCSMDTDIPVGAHTCPTASDEAAASAPQSAAPAAVPHADAASKLAQGSLLANFNGISDVDSHAVNGFHDTPPDQALCVGNAEPLEAAGLPLGVPGGTTVALEGVNSAYTVYSTSGAVLFGPDTLADLFSDPNASGDITCLFDTSKQTFYFAEIGVLLSGPDVNNFNTDLAVISPKGYAAYQIDTSVGGNCFPDFPHDGFDTHGFYLTVNQFCGPTQAFAGAMMWAFSKSQLASLDTSVNFDVFGLLSLGGTPVLSLQPAVGDPSNVEYLVNSFPRSRATQTTIGVWEVDGDQHLDSGSGTVTLNGSVVSSEAYARPVQAVSTGTGLPVSPGSDILSERLLNPDDSRMEQVQLVSTNQGPRLFTSLNTVLTVGTDPTKLDGVAWFEIDPVAQTVVNQGYVAAAGTYLMYPTILRGSTGLTVIDFSMTSPTLNPSTGYVFMGAGDTSFSSIQTTATGLGPHVSFSDINFHENRWGDYSAAALDLNGNDIWVADEYIPPAPAGLDKVDNWGTRVWDVAG